MGNTLGNKLRITVGGQSHSTAITAIIDGIPAGTHIDFEAIEAFLKRRQGGNLKYTTPRKEADKPIILSGLKNSITTGSPLCVMFENGNVRSSDYDNLRIVPRPSHADYTAYVKYNGYADMAGGGQFSGRMTLPICFAGAIAKDMLSERGISVNARILSIGGIAYEEEDKVTALLDEVYNEGDSIGGIIECVIDGVPAGYGDPLYDSIESRISYAMFGIPAVKGIEFGAGFDIAKMKGSVANDAFIGKDGKIMCKTNNSGGIQGGITNGMPIKFNVCIKPTPSIAREQESVNLVNLNGESLKIEGRHDVCIVPRALPCVEAMAAVTLLDIIL